jgi:hypothetical protein
MSWNLSFVAQSKDSAKEYVDNQKKTRSYLPQGVVDGLKSTLDAFPDDLSGRLIHIECSGHIDTTYGGNSRCEIKLLPIVV